VVGFEQFLLDQPVIDWIWSLIKGLLPTMVALYAIWKNDKKTKKRDLESKRSQFIVDYVNRMIGLLQDLSINVQNNQKLLYNIIFSVDDQKKHEELEKIKMDFVIGRFNMIDKLLILKDYELSLGKEMGVTFNSELLVDSIDKYQKELLKIKNTYPPVLHNQDKSDEIMNKLNDSLAEVRTDIFSCIKLLALKISEEYKSKR